MSEYPFEAQTLPEEFSNLYPGLWNLHRFFGILLLVELANFLLRELIVTQSQIKSKIDGHSTITTVQIHAVSRG